jgi:hypothetical protein
VDMHATDLVGINGITLVLSVYTCQQGVYPRGHVLPLRLPVLSSIYSNYSYGFFVVVDSASVISSNQTAPISTPFFCRV